MAADGLRLLVATGPAVSGDLLDHDLEVLRPALLFADEVVLLSPAAWMVFGIAADVSHEDPVARAQVLSSLVGAVPNAQLPEELTTILAGIAKTNQLLRQGNRQQRRAMKRLLGKQGDELRRMAGMIDAQYEMLRDHVYETMIDGRPAEELAVAAGRNVLTVDGLGFESGAQEIDDVMELWWERIQKAIVDPHTFVLFDEQVAGLIRAHVREQGVEIPDLASTQQRQSGLAAGFLTRLPTLDRATVEEILDFRREVAAEVAIYRATTAEMASAIAEPAHAEDFDAVINNRWINEVQPALREIEVRADEAGLLNRMLDEASRSGLVVGGLLTGAFAAGSLADWTAAVPAAAAATIKYGWDVHRAGASARSELRGHRFILVHEAGKHLGN